MVSSVMFSLIVVLLSVAVGAPQATSSTTSAPDPEQLASRIRALVRALQDADQLLRALQDYRQRHGDPTILDAMKDDANRTMIERLKSIMAKDVTTSNPSRISPKKSIDKRKQSNSTSRVNNDPPYRVIIKDLTLAATGANDTLKCRVKTCSRARNKSPRTLESGARTRPRSTSKRAMNDRKTTKKVSALLHTINRSDNGIETPLISNIYPMFGPGSGDRKDPVEFVPRDTGGVIHPPTTQLLPPFLPMQSPSNVFLGETPWIPVVSPFLKDQLGNNEVRAEAVLKVGLGNDSRKKHKTLSFDTNEWKYTDVQDEENTSDRGGRGRLRGQREQDQQLQLLHHIQQINRMHPQDLPKTVAETMYFKRQEKENDKNDELLTGSIPGIPGRDYPAFSAAPSPPMQCRNRRGYFGDPRSRCQAFYICQGDGRGEVMLCPNGTIFNQDVLVCDWWFNVECPRDSR